MANNIAILTTPSSSSSSSFYSSSPFIITNTYSILSPTPTTSLLSPDDPYPTISYYTPRKLTQTLAMVLLIGGLVVLLLCLIVCIFGYIRYRKRIQEQMISVSDTQEQDAVCQVVVVPNHDNGTGGGDDSAGGGGGGGSDVSSTKEGQDKVENAGRRWRWRWWWRR
ncbi:MAG: hypothetical protein JOS17DRAFT_790826 [Linnemannia elongata]|nr:MAG: hypothetical protein JOS17DRAFT_790826 [Linnemannia elongata]